MGTANGIHERIGEATDEADDRAEVADPLERPGAMMASLSSVKDRSRSVSRLGRDLRDGSRAIVLLSALTILLHLADCPRTRGSPRIDRAFPILSLTIGDTLGNPLETRVRILGSDGLIYPACPDSTWLSYARGGGFFYARAGTAAIKVPHGLTRLTVGRGFEWSSSDQFLQVISDTSVTIQLDRFTDLRTEGWFPGEIHAHTRHEPIDYTITPGIAKQIASAEGLAVSHFLDQQYEFTGTPHEVSDGETIIYYATEYRNQTYGHAPLPGLGHFVGDWCCQDPLPAYPMLLDLHNLVVPELGPMLVLAHPHTTDDYFQDESWPGAGLGRELPVLAALGALDAMEVVSLNNDPWEDWDEWYDVLSSGLPCPPVSGTDQTLCRAFSYPLGCWRVYAQLEAGEPFTYDAWLDALARGRTFITNYPLIPEFQIDGRGPGDSLSVEGDLLEAEVHLRALSAHGLTRVTLIADGIQVWSASLQHDPLFTTVDTTFAISIPTPSWIAAKVTGFPGDPHACVGQPIAHTNAIRIYREDAPRRQTAACGRWLDSLEMLESLVSQRGNWEEAWQSDTVLARIDRAGAYYRSAFVIPPGPFALLAPEDGDTVATEDLLFEWVGSTDPEDGDRIEYWLIVASDSTFSHPIFGRTEDLQYEPTFPLLPGHTYWWAVDAYDRAGNVRRSTPSVASFHLGILTSAMEEDCRRSEKLPRPVPNPSAAQVRLEGLSPPVVILDVTGRVVARDGEGIAVVDGVVTWNGQVRGRPAPPGVYWAREVGRGVVARLIRIP